MGYDPLTYLTNTRKNSVYQGGCEDGGPGCCMAATLISEGIKCNKEQSQTEGPCKEIK